MRTVRKSKRVSLNRRRKRSWNLLGPKSGLRHSIRLFGLAVLVCLSTMAVFAAVVLYGYLKMPLAAAAGDFHESKGWVEEGRRNLLLVVLDDLREPTAAVTSLAIASFNYTGETLTLTEVPVDVETTIPEGYGPGRLGTAYALGGLASPPKNAALLLTAVRNYLGLPIDGYLLIDQPGLSQLTDLLGEPPTIEKLKSRLSPLRIGEWPKLLNWLRLNIRTDLNLPEIIAVGRFAASIRFDKLTTVSLSDWANNENLFTDPKVRAENIKVLILNGTAVSGLAVRGQALVENLGALVAGIGNAPRQDYQRSLIVAGENSAYTTTRLGQAFGIAEFKSMETFINEPNYDFLKRADIVIILGLDKSLEL